MIKAASTMPDEFSNDSVTFSACYPLMRAKAFLENGHSHSERGENTPTVVSEGRLSRGKPGGPIGDLCRQLAPERCFAKCI
jgi:hypothetical protein